MNPVRHKNGQIDMRYEVALESCGYEKPRYVARFCGEWIGQSISPASASLMCIGHNAVRNGARVFTEIPAETEGE